MQSNSLSLPSLSHSQDGVWTVSALPALLPDSDVACAHATSRDGDGLRAHGHDGCDEWHAHELDEHASRHGSHGARHASAGRAAELLQLRRSGALVQGLSQKYALID